MDILTLETAREMTLGDLRAALTASMDDAAEGIREACVCLCELARRGEKLPELARVFAFRREIAEGALSPKAAWLMPERPGVLKRLAALPDHALQERLAEGLPVKVAVRSNAGRITSLDKRVDQMTDLQLRMALCPERGITPIEEQQRWLHESGVTEAPRARVAPKVRVCPETGELLIGRARLTVEDLKQPLLTVGYMVKPVYAQKKAG